MHRVRPSRGFCLAVPLVALALALSALPALPAVYTARALTRTVDNAGDAVANATRCTNGTVGDCTLRDAIAAASPGDTITFSLPSGTTITLTQGELAVNKGLTISGPGRNRLAISGNSASRVFSVSGGSLVAISGVAITNAQITDSGGAGVQSLSTPLTLTDCAFMGNRLSSASTFGSGGGVRVADASLTVTRCTFTGNSAAVGGAISADALTVTDSSFISNTATGGPSTTGDGGAINSDGTLSVSGSTFVDNAAQKFGNIIGSGGGVHHSGSANGTVTRSTFVGNSATLGGGLYLSSSGTVALTNLTVTGNTASNASGGGGVRAFNGSITVGNSIFSGNTASTAPNDFQGSVATNNGYNLVGVASPAFTGTGNIAGVNTPLLNALDNNGGFTQTMLPQASSPAVNAGNPAGCGSEDQRGAIRPFGGRCEIGATEYRVLSVQPVQAGVNAPQTVTITGTGFFPGTALIPGTQVKVRTAVETVTSVSPDGTSLTFILDTFNSVGNTYALTVTNPDIPESVTSTVLYVTPNAAPTPTRPAAASGAQTPAPAPQFARPAAPTSPAPAPTPLPAPLAR